MKFSKEHIVEVGDDGIIYLREPTNKEYSKYINGKIKYINGKAMNTLPKAARQLFDSIVTKLENIEGDDGPIGLDNLSDIPDRDKVDIIVAKFEQSKVKHEISDDVDSDEDEDPIKN